jgi:hypothetical protein
VKQRTERHPLVDSALFKILSSDKQPKPSTLELEVLARYIRELEREIASAFDIDTLVETLRWARGEMEFGE